MNVICQWILCINMLHVQVFGIFIERLKCSIPLTIFGVVMNLVRNLIVVETIKLANYDLANHK
ncbi:hypothetical protein [Pantoea sp. Mhis]|uniref:hypothetical protein n=1 Tax=Pantoea sp. Mhis TaxID=2576759 RepID=UPI001359CD68|nr:hypothetical protein [Pantoea sp. Mhis]MXP56220.1 hypothetical protein [Pantoea sp. Mhis]